MIPRIIHYCWLGRGKVPELARNCVVFAGCCIKTFDDLLYFRIGNNSFRNGYFWNVQVER